MLFEIAVAFSIAMVETSRPFDSVGSAAGPFGCRSCGSSFVGRGDSEPRRMCRLALALAAATTWPLAYWINSARFGFVTESWRHTSIWPAMNYLLAVVAYLVGG